jgi:hypothetical protein
MWNRSILKPSLRAVSAKQSLSNLSCRWLNEPIEICNFAMLIICYSFYQKHFVTQSNCFAEAARNDGFNHIHNGKKIGTRIFAEKDNRNIYFELLLLVLYL